MGEAVLERLRSARQVGLVLSGGGARCAFQVGVLEALDELGVRPALCVGVSAGVPKAGPPRALGLCSFPLRAGPCSSMFVRVRSCPLPRVDFYVGMP